MVEGKSEAITELGEIVYWNGPFYESYKRLISKCIDGLISARDLAYVRMGSDRDSSLNCIGSYTREGFLYQKNKPVLMVLESPFLNKQPAREATITNHNGNYYTTSSIVYNRAMDQVKREEKELTTNKSVFILPTRENFLISSKENFYVLETILKDQADRYLHYNGSIPFYLVDKDLVDSIEGTLITQMWFRGINKKSEIEGNLKGFQTNLRLRGINKNHTDPPILFDDPREKYSSIIKGVKEGILPISRLDEILVYLEQQKCRFLE